MLMLSPADTLKPAPQPQAGTAAEGPSPFCRAAGLSLAALARRKLDVRIVVVDNDGGAIFDFLAQAEHLEPELFERLWGTPHGTSFRQLAAAHGLDHAEATDPESLAASVRRRGPSMTVVRSSRPANVSRHRAVNAAVAAALRA
jgi:2-succinyl-5-enolpyruvyl-6-hydroxy-3-cyclohexene-1-carboxylate synthase